MSSSGTTCFPGSQLFENALSPDLSPLDNLGPTYEQILLAFKIEKIEYLWKLEGKIILLNF